MRLIIELDLPTDKKESFLITLEALLRGLDIKAMAILSAPDEIVPDTSIVHDWASTARIVNERLLGDKRPALDSIPKTDT